MTTNVKALTNAALNRRASKARLRRNRRNGWLFISPWVVGFLAFFLFPFIASLYLSFTKYDILNPPKWIGFHNYSSLMHDPLFWQSLYNTLYYTAFFVPLSTIMSIFIALLLNMNIRGLSIYRTIFYLPAIVPFVASSILWLWLFNPSFGFLDAFLRMVGLPAPGWLYDVHWVKPAFVLMTLWGTGQMIVIYLAGLQGVSKDLYEAAIIEGANAWQRSIKITIPMISPVILFNVIIGLINAFQFFTQAFVMTQGGPDNASMFFALYLYQQAFQFLHLGYASAMAWILFVIILVVTLLVYGGSSRYVYYGSEQ